MGYKYLPLTAECCASRMHFALEIASPNKECAAQAA